MKKDDFFQFFVEELKNLYDVENQLVEALPEMIEAASFPDLREAFQEHLKETKNQVLRLEQIFEMLDVRPEIKPCAVMKCLIQEADARVKEHPPSAIRDASLISAAQRIEHYEIAVYGALRTYANQMDLTDISDLLQKSLDEEGGANKTLSEIAEGGFFSAGVNQRALEGS